MVPRHLLFFALPAAALAFHGSSQAQTTVTSQVNSGSDDVEEEVATGTMDLTSSDLELINDQSFRGPQLVGVRFTAVNVPQGATINSAFVQFDCDDGDVGFDTPTADLVIKAQAADDTVTFAGTTSELSSRPTTTASVAWSSIPSWVAGDGAGANEKTPDLAPIIQEVVSRAGWVSGNSIVIVFTGTGERTADSFNGVPAAAPLLSVTYGGPSAVPSWEMY